MEQIQLLVEQALSIYGFVDILFNNAGISQRALAGTTSPKVEKLIFDINYANYFLKIMTYVIVF